MRAVSVRRRRRKQYALISTKHTSTIDDTMITGISHDSRSGPVGGGPGAGGLRGEGGGENETEETAPVMEFTAKDATVLMERAAKAAERAASVAEWRSRTVSAATMYAAMALSGVSAFVRADVMMCAIALYATRPARLRVIPDPINACWSRLPSLWKDQSKIQ